MTVDLQKDINIYHTPKFASPIQNGKIYVICRLGCGLGHIGRIIYGFCNEETFNNTFKDKIKKEEGGRYGFLVDPVDVDKVRSHNDNKTLLDFGFDHFDKYILVKMQKQNEAFGDRDEFDY